MQSKPDATPQAVALCSFRYASTAKSGLKFSPKINSDGSRQIFYEGFLPLYSFEANTILLEIFGARWFPF